MPKFEIEVEIQGFKLRMKGEANEDLPRVTGEIGKHLAGLLQPPANLLNGPVIKEVASQAEDGQDGSGKGKGNRRRKVVGSNTNGSAVAPLSWQHDPSKWGSPKQAWTAMNKILWLLYVIKNEVSQTEVSGPVIAETFNDKFRQFGPLKKSSMPRALGALKINQPMLVSDDTTKSPITWFLTDEGNKAAERLVQDAKGGTSGQ